MTSDIGDVVIVLDGGYDLVGQSDMNILRPFA